MKIHEYQAKEILRKYGVATPRGIEGRNPMTKRLVLVLAACLLMVPRLDAAEDAKAVLDGVGKAMGEVNSLQYSGSGAFFSLGQSFTPGEPWPRFGLKSYTPHDRLRDAGAAR